MLHQRCFKPQRTLALGLNGRQVVEAARTGRPDLKVLFITGFAENAAIGHGHLDPGMQFVTAAFANKVAEIIKV